MAAPYAPLDIAEIAPRLGGLDAMRARVDPDPAAWTAREVGDGNLNLVFIVEGPRGGVVVKQALPYVRLVGESWPLPLTRAFFERNALVRQAARAPGIAPEVLHFDDDQALIVMELLSPHIILRQALIEGRRTEGLGRTLGLFCAQTLFRGSELSMATAEKKADVALFADNVALCDITENLVFTDPYFDAEMNRHTSPHLDGLVAELRADRELKIAAQSLKTAFATRSETMLHGDLHTGSIMVTERETRVIDPEFALYGPMGFDVGMLISNFLMAWFSQPGHETRPGERAAHGDWILGLIEEIWSVFSAEFSRLWREERTGMLFARSLFEDQGQGDAAEEALAGWLRALWVDAMGFAGVELHRRILGLAHNADFETIADETRRAACEAPALRLGRRLMLPGGDFGAPSDLTAAARRFAEEAAP